MQDAAARCWLLLGARIGEPSALLRGPSQHVLDTVETWCKTQHAKRLLHE